MYMYTHLQKYLYYTCTYPHMNHLVNIISVCDFVSTDFWLAKGNSIPWSTHDCSHVCYNGACMYEYTSTHTSCAPAHVTIVVGFAHSLYRACS